MQYLFLVVTQLCSIKMKSSWCELKILLHFKVGYGTIESWVTTHFSSTKIRD